MRQGVPVPGNERTKGSAYTALEDGGGVYTGDPAPPAKRGAGAFHLRDLWGVLDGLIWRTGRQKKEGRMTGEKGWLFWAVESAKELERQLLEEDPDQAEAVAVYTDAFYPLDAVQEILRDGEGTINEAAPSPSSLQNAYYYCEEMDGAYAFCEVREGHVKELLCQLADAGFWMPDPAQYGNFQFYRYSQEEYAGWPLYFLEFRLYPEEQGELIRKFCQWYGDTDQETGQFAAEFYLVASGILGGMLVLNPRYLLLEDVIPELIEVLPEAARSCYTDSRRKIREGKRPFPCKE